MGSSALFYFVNFIYMEFIFHLYFWKNVKISLLPGIFVIAFFSVLQAYLQSFLKKRASKLFGGIFLAWNYLLFGSQMVYHSIFKMPLLIDAIIMGGGDALTNYWRETLEGILHAGFGLLALLLGIIWVAVVSRICDFEERICDRKVVAVRSGCLFASCLLLAGCFFGMYHLDEEHYTEYQEFGYPDEILEDFGVVSFWFRNANLILLPEKEEQFAQIPTMPYEKETTGADAAEQGSSVIATEEGQEGSAGSETAATEWVPAQPTYTEQVLAVDVDYLKELGTDDVDAVTEYVLAMAPTKTNDYTGLFEGYNLIYITAEGFSTAAIDETLTPTLYKLTHSGVVAKNYYVPLWQTSTSDGEYANLTGLIPDQQFSMSRSAKNSQPFSLASHFKEEGAVCYAYHNNSLSYYDRYLSHPNMGYIFKASKLGNLDASEWGDYVFEMEHANYWPASDLDMFQATVPEYINEERFHVYYMTVSGHMNYNFTGNKMSSLHYEEVKDLPYSEEGKAYIACNIELDRALGYLLAELENAGKLDNTVICLSADHYPYAMNLENYEELMEMDLENSLDIYRNSLILWNAEMETIEVEKPCDSLDLLPTLLNLFGFSYDSRLYSGQDIFADAPGLVVFSNRSFITDVASYNKKTGEVLSGTGEPVSEAYIEQMKSYVTMLYKHSAGILNTNYYEYFQQALR